MAKNKTKVKKQKAKAAATKGADKRYTRGMEDNGRPNIAVLGSVDDNIYTAGGNVVWVPSYDEDAWKTIGMADIDGVLLTGGGDVHPKWYGETPHKRCYGFSELRDATEMAVLEEARLRGIPILGICRGSQIMNVHAGGTLHQHIQDFDHTHNWHQGSDCRVVATRGSRLAKAWTQREQWTIHIHHQAVKDVAPGYVVTARAHDGTIEATESVEGWELGVQFHPEMDDSKHAQRIFDRFVLAAARNAGLPDPIVPEWKPKTKIGQAIYGWDSDTGWGAQAKTTVAKSASESAAVFTGNRNGPITKVWTCGQCSNIRFDERSDWIDHMQYLHETPAVLLPDARPVSNALNLAGSSAATRGK